MKDWATVFANYSGVYPNVLAVDSSGAATPDGTEFIAAGINNWQMGVSQALMSYAGLTPDGVTEAAGACQMIEAIQKGNGIGPGKYVQWGLYDDPSVTGDRVILLAEQGVLVASYPDLSAAVYVGDANNAAVAAAGGKFYKSSDAAGTTPNTAGPYIQLPAQPEPTYFKSYSEAGGYFAVSGPAGWSTSYSSLIPYKSIDGIYRLNFNIQGSQTSASASQLVITGVTFHTTAKAACSLSNETAGSATYQARVVGSSNNITCIFASNVSEISVSGDVELDSWPTWADDFDYIWGITY